jgi:hypothetical protein
MKVVSAIFLGLLLIMLIPRAKTMLETSPEAVPGDWRAALLPLLAVVALVALLMALV